MTAATIPVLRPFERRLSENACGGCGRPLVPLDEHGTCELCSATCDSYGDGTSATAVDAIEALLKALQPEKADVLPLVERYCAETPAGNDGDERGRELGKRADQETASLAELFVPARFAELVESEAISLTKAAAEPIEGDYDDIVALAPADVARIAQLWSIAHEIRRQRDAGGDLRLIAPRTDLSEIAQSVVSYAADYAPGNSRRAMTDPVELELLDEARPLFEAIRAELEGGEGR